MFRFSSQFILFLDNSILRSSGLIDRFNICMYSIKCGSTNLISSALQGAISLLINDMTQSDKDMIILMQKSINSLNSESSVIRHQNIFTLLSVQPARDMIIFLFHLSINIFRSSWAGKCKQNTSVWKRRHPPYSHLRPRPVLLGTDIFSPCWHYDLWPSWYDHLLITENYSYFFSFFLNINIFGSSWPSRGWYN